MCDCYSTVVVIIVEERENDNNTCLSMKHVKSEYKGHILGSSSLIIHVLIGIAYHLFLMKSLFHDRNVVFVLIPAWNIVDEPQNRENDQAAQHADTNVKRCAVTTCMGEGTTKVSSIAWAWQADKRMDAAKSLLER